MRDARATGPRSEIDHISKGEKNGKRGRPPRPTSLMVEALEIRRGMAEQNIDVPQVKRIEFRIGIHVGDIIIEDRRRHAYMAFHHPAQRGGQSLKGGAARRGREVLLDDAGESDVAVPSTQEDALRRDDILGAVGQLPDDQRSVLLLVSVADVTYAEAARILDIPIGTVMSRLARYQSRSASASDLPMSNYSSKLVPYGSTSPAASTPAATTICRHRDSRRRQEGRGVLSPNAQ